MGCRANSTPCSWFHVLLWRPESIEGYRSVQRLMLNREFPGFVLVVQPLAETNADPKPFTWTEDPDKIIVAVKRGHQVLDSFQREAKP